MEQDTLKFFPVWSCEEFPLLLPAGHPFPNQKYSTLESTLKEKGFEPFLTRCTKANPELLLLAHDQKYVDRVLANALSAEEIRRVGFPPGERYLNRALASVQATFEAMLTVTNQSHTVDFKKMKRRSSLVSGALAGGTHHAYRDHGEGYCTFNDIAVATTYALQHSVDRVLVVDLDAHQGNGTASIFASEPRVFTFSMHCENNYPRPKEKSSLDIGLPLGADDACYLAGLRENLPQILDFFAPELVFYQAGVDVLALDRFGKLGLSLDGLLQRDTLVFEQVLGRQIPCVITIGGGYQHNHTAVGLAHAQTYFAAASVHARIL